MARQAKSDEFIRVPFMQRKKSKNMEIPVFEIPSKSMDPNAAKRIVQDELNLDGNPTLNMASFVNTKMDKQCDELMTENLSKNFIDTAEYPQCSVIESRCVAMLRKLFNAPEESLKEEKRVYHPSSPPTKVHGKSTVGSSEAIMVAAMNMKWNWSRKQPTVDGNIASPCITEDFDKCGNLKPNREGKVPNLVFGETAHVCWHKFCRYFSVKMNRVPIKANDATLDVDKAIQMCDENTIGVVAILGSTYTGEFDNVALLNKKLDELNRKNGWEIPIHVDAASGGMIAALLFPDLEWDFRLKWVKSINISGHKYGLVYPGIGWFLLRDYESLHKGIIFEVDYLGERELTLTLNFSKGASHVIAQYYQFLRLGKEGYKLVFEECMANAKYIEKSLREWEGINGKKFFEMHSNVCSGAPSLPVVAFAANEKSLQMRLETFVEKLKNRGWIIPVCHLPLPKNVPEKKIARIVLREAHSEMLINLLIWDIHRGILTTQKDRNLKINEQLIDSEADEVKTKKPVIRKIDSIC